MELLIGIVIGTVAATTVTLGVDAPARVLVPVRRPPSIRTLGGRIRRYVVTRPRPLPVRVPGAALVLNPAPLPGELSHVTPVARWRVYAERFVRWLSCVIAAESDEAFRIGLQTNLEQCRRYQVHGRHRLDDLRANPAWRNRWAAYDTQSWPTLEMNPFDDLRQRCRDRFPVKFLEPVAPDTVPGEAPLPVG